MKRLLTITVVLAGAATLSATIPDGYYSSLDGKSGDALAAAVAAIADGHTKVTYSTKTWPAFEITDVRVINGRELWWDMYSNNIVYLPDHAALNIEHSVAKSWWGGDTSVGAYTDLFHLNPCDQNANNKKSNYPLGEVATTTFLDNGLSVMGSPKEGQGGGSNIVFEPADEYKGDFARAYLYIFTTYGDIEWDPEYLYMYDADGSLLDWAKELLLRWSGADPVDSKESNRNEAIYALQANRNPFIDYPQLADYLYGDKRGETFLLSEQTPAENVERPAAPEFPESRMVGVNTYSRRWWDGFEQDVNYTGERLMLSLDGRDWYESDHGISLDAATATSQPHYLLAYSVATVNGTEYRSSISRIDFNPRDTEMTDYSLARWELMTAGEAITTTDRYILLSSNTLHAMSTDGGTSAKAFLESAGFVDFTGEYVTETPVDAALVTFSDAGNGKYILDVNDMWGDFKGHWNASAKNKMKLDISTGTPATAEIGEGNYFIFTFDQNGSLQFNKTQPRFLNYSSNQTPVYLYRFLDFERPGSGVEAPVEQPWGVSVSGHDIIAPAGAAVYDLNGRRVTGQSLAPGVYIVTAPGHSVKIAVR